MQEIKVTNYKDDEKVAWDYMNIGVQVLIILVYGSMERHQGSGTAWEWGLWGRREKILKQGYFFTKYACIKVLND